MQAENLGKIHKNSLASGGFVPEPPDRLKIFNYSYIFIQLRAKIHVLFVNVLNFTLLISTNFLEFFLPSGGSAPRTPHYSMSILDYLFFP